MVQNKKNFLIQLQGFLKNEPYQFPDKGFKDCSSQNPKF